jgi:glycosyltransferase involved in cell wall biosynthesis
VNVLLCISNPYEGVGGGEIFYRNLIEKTPEINFYYLSKYKSPTNLPKNLTAIQLKSAPKIKSLSKIMDTNGLAKKIRISQLNPTELGALYTSLQIAKSISQVQVDHIHVPEYLILDQFLTPALEAYEIKKIPISLFLHGSLSKTQSLILNPNRDKCLQLKESERRQRKAADKLIALEGSNIAHIDAESINRVEFLKPIFFVNKSDRKQEVFGEHKQNDENSVALVGRIEGTKGHRNFIHAYGMSKFSSMPLKIYYPENNQTEFRSLVEFASKRNVMLEGKSIKISQNFWEMVGLDEVIAIPSLFDSFNLMSFEALIRGNKILISKEAGAYKYFKSKGLKLHGFNPKSLKETVDAINSLNKIKGISPEVLKTSDIFIRSNHSKNSDLSKIFITERKTVFSREPFLSRYHLELKTRNGLKDIGSDWIKKRIRENGKIRSILIVSKSVHVRAEIKALFSDKLNHSTRLVVRDLLRYKKFIQKKKSSFNNDKPEIFARTVLQKELVFDAIESENLTLAEVYLSRLLRNSEVNNQNNKQLLEKIGKETGNDWIVNDFLEKRERKQATQSKEKISRKFASRPTSKINPKISIIVSAFNGGSKLKCFFENLSRVPEVKSGICEVILVDAASPTDDAALALELALKLKISLRSYRMRHRISIQEAWNVGISKSKAEYIVFLGLDEAIRPDALTILMKEFSLNPELDWVTGNSLILDVDENGEWQSDKGFYDRKGANGYIQLLDASYVNFVGGMYKRSIHSKYGMYDERFLGAGDTQFKTRIFPNLKVGFLDATLGYFLDYPEVRTTATPRVEYEDLAAWYRYRKSSSLEKVLENLDSGELNRIFTLCLGYRKSYAKHISTDLLIAESIANILERRKSPINGSTRRLLRVANEGYRFIFDEKVSVIRHLANAIRTAIAVNKLRSDEKFRGINILGALRLDNRLEQHSWWWN